MKVETQEWVTKAEYHWNIVNKLLCVIQNPAPQAIGFHAHQSIEMYLQARLIEADIVLPETQSLFTLFTRVLTVEPRWEPLGGVIDRLSRYFVAARLAVDPPDRKDTEEARKICAEVRAVIRPALGLSV